MQLISPPKKFSHGIETLVTNKKFLRPLVQYWWKLIYTKLDETFLHLSDAGVTLSIDGETGNLGKIPSLIILSQINKIMLIIRTRYETMVISRGGTIKTLTGYLPKVGRRKPTIFEVQHHLFFSCCTPCVYVTE